MESGKENSSTSRVAVPGPSKKRQKVDSDGDTEPTQVSLPASTQIAKLQKTTKTNPLDLENIVENVAKFAEFQDVLTMRMVNSTWEKEAKKELNKRECFVKFGAVAYEKEDRTKIEKFLQCVQNRNQLFGEDENFPFTRITLRTEIKDICATKDEIRRLLECVSTFATDLKLKTLNKYSFYGLIPLPDSLDFPALSTLEVGQILAQRSMLFLSDEDNHYKHIKELIIKLAPRLKTLYLCRVLDKNILPDLAQLEELKICDLKITIEHMDLSNVEGLLNKTAKTLIKLSLCAKFCDVTDDNEMLPGAQFLSLVQLELLNYTDVPVWNNLLVNWNYKFPILQSFQYVSTLLRTYDGSTIEPFYRLGSGVSHTKIRSLLYTGMVTELNAVNIAHELPNLHPNITEIVINAYAFGDLVPRLVYQLKFLKRLYFDNDTSLQETRPKRTSPPLWTRLFGVDPLPGRIDWNKTITKGKLQSLQENYKEQLEREPVSGFNRLDYINIKKLSWYDVRHHVFPVVFLQLKNLKRLDIWTRLYQEAPKAVIAELEKNCKVVASGLVEGYYLNCFEPEWHV